jgi:hypothetical protein
MFLPPGAFGLQAMGATFVKTVTGCPYSVEGLPASAIAKKLSLLIDEGVAAADGTTSATGAAGDAAGADSEGIHINIAPARPLTEQQVREEKALWRQLVGTSSRSGWLQPLQINANAHAHAKNSSISTIRGDGGGSGGGVGIGVGKGNLHAGSKAADPAVD